MPNIIRVSPNVMQKMISGGGSDFNVPDRWSLTSYGSGWPIQPVSPPQDTQLPRTIDYPISVNASLTPRTGYGHMSFAALLEAYENVAEARIPVELLHRQLAAFIPHLVDDSGNEVHDHPYIWMAQSPDGKVPFSIWLTRFLKSTKVYDAPAVYIERTGNATTGLHFIDGSTLFLIVDEYGNTPEPEPVDQYINRILSDSSGSSISLPSNNDMNGVPTNIKEFVAMLALRESKGLTNPAKLPAYTQVIKGTPFSWWSADQIWYRPQSRRMNSPYGESFIEIVWAWIMIVVNITAFELGHYRTGNMPEGFVTLPREEYGSVDRVLAAEQMYNFRMTSNPATERMRLRMFPDGAKYFPTKKPDFPAQLYSQAWKNILHAIGIPPSEFGDVPGQGLGGKGFKEGSASELGRNTLDPHRDFVGALFNEILRKDGVDDVHWELAYPMTEVDPDKQKKSLWEGMIHGTMSLNDVLGELAMDPVGDPNDRNNIANMHLIVAGTNIYVVEKMQINETGMAIPTMQPNPSGGASGGKPVGPESAVEQDGAQHTSEDGKTLMRAIRNIIDNGTLDAKFVSIPNEKPLAKEVTIQIKTPPVFDQFTPGPPDHTAIDLTPAATGVEQRRDRETPILPVSETEDNARPIGVSHMAQWYPDALAQEQAAHPDWTREECEALVRANIREKFDYYGYEPLNEVTGKPDPMNPIAPRLDKYLGSAMLPELQKHCGVCPEDDDYFGAEISRQIQFDFPATNHANDVEIVAMCPPGLPPKAALWKPEGGEVDDLQSAVGGPQYAREEATYLLDRSLGFMIVPVAYVAESEGEIGAAIYYTGGAELGGYLDQYAPEWLEKAAVLDYISSQIDRHVPGHNYLTHPDDPTRLILIDNGLSFPVDPDMYCNSPFCANWLGKQLSDPVIQSIVVCLSDVATWRDIQRLVGTEATQKARACAQRLLLEGMITPNEGTTTTTSSEYSSNDSGGL